MASHANLEREKYKAKVSPPHSSCESPSGLQSCSDAAVFVENPLLQQRQGTTGRGLIVAAPVDRVGAEAAECGPTLHSRASKEERTCDAISIDTSAALGRASSNSSSNNNLCSPSERQWRLDHSRFAAARKDPETASTRRRGLIQRSDPVIGYYRRQNEMIDGFSEMDALSEHLLSPSYTVAVEAANMRMGGGEKLAIHLSNIFNIFLLVVKIVASVESRSLAIIASTLDSVLDCLSGFILWYTARSMQLHNPYKYPIGKKRMQPLGIIIFACIMAMLGLQILVEAVRQLLDSSHTSGLGEHWQVYVAIMCLAIAVKLGLYLYCRLFENEIVQAYAQDHFFDVVTNVVGLAAAVLAGAFAWWIDPLGAILLSLYTMTNWSRTVYESAKSLTGQSAPPEFLQKLTYLCWNHHEAIMMIDTVRAYTFGSSYFTEVDVVLPKDMPLNVAHDIGESLQDKLESVPEIERAFVHLDYEVSHRPEHHHAHAHFKAPPGGPSMGDASAAATASEEVQEEPDTATVELTSL